jgi:hypothetical protein
MSNLLDLQDGFQNYLFKGHTQFRRMVIGTETFSADTRLAIYSNAYRSRLLDTLASNYPVLVGYLGTEKFI